MPAYLPARLRIPSYAVWETAVLVLNVLAFLVIGLELGPIIAAAAPGELGRWAEIGAAVLATVIAVRLLWTLATALWAQWRVTAGDAAVPGGGPLPSWRTGLIIGWAGTRGLVTVASALALPQDFPQRGMLLFAAFSVTFGTLLIQGLTLRPLVLALNVRDDGPIDREVREARVATAGAALAVLQKETGEDAAILRAELHAERLAAEGAQEGDGRPTFPVKRLRARAVAARRERLLALRREGVIGDEAFHRLEEELDLADLALSTRT
jgi:CPA1 family monovalent cation:H+ antiporter